MTFHSLVVDSLDASDAVLAVDVSHLAYRAAYAYSTLRTTRGVFSGHIHGSMTLLLYTLEHDLPTHRWCIAYCYDGPKAKSARQEILPSYKAHREKKEDAFNPLPDVYRLFRGLPGIHLEAPGHEGDDACAWIAKKIPPSRPVYIMSGDQDVWGLYSPPNVQIYVPRLGRLINENDILSRFHVKSPDRVYLAKALFGDSSDGIHGVGRLVKKTVETFLQAEYPAGADFVDAFYDLALAPGSGLNAGTRQKLIDARQDVKRNMQVLLPRIDGFSKENVLQRGYENRNEVTDMLTQFECLSLLSKIDMLYGLPFFVTLDPSKGGEL